MTPAVVRAGTGSCPVLAWAVSFDPLHEFQAFTWFHAVVALTLLGICTVVSLVGRRWRGTQKETMLGAFLGGFILARQAVEVIWYLLPAQFSWEKSLPFQFCDVAPWIAAIVLLTERRWARVLLYYWGMAMCTQAFFTPTLSEGMLHTRFWWFWLCHTHIVGSAMYDMIARGFRPTWADMRFALCITTSLTVLMIIFDAVTGMNYGYVGPGSPKARTIIDAIGPYPWRLPVLMSIVVAAFVVLTAVWRPASRPAGG